MEEAGPSSQGELRLDVGRRRLFREGVPVELKNKALDILCVLAAAQGQIVSKDEIMAKVWPGLVVEESNIQVHISAIRKALGEDLSRPRHLFTAPGRGYRLVGLDISAVKEAVSAASEAMAEVAKEADRPSIAVLPFQNLSSDPEQEYFADGMVEDIITGLSRIKWLRVIARNSSFTFKGKTVDVRRVGSDLGVRYLLQGSVRKSGDRIRIAAQLIETESGIQVWGERYDRQLDDIFAIQDEIAISVVGAVEPGLQKIEVERVKRKRPENLHAYDLVLQALP
jgi:TolB-like protein